MDDLRGDPPELEATSGEFPAGVRSSKAPEENAPLNEPPQGLPLGARPGDPSLPPRHPHQPVVPARSTSFERTALPQALQLGASADAAAAERDGLPRGIQQSVVAPLPTPPDFDDQTLVEPATSDAQHPKFADSSDEIGTVADVPAKRRQNVVPKKFPPPVAQRAPRPSVKQRPAPAEPRSSAKKTMMGVQGFEPPRRLDAHRADWAEQTIAQSDHADELSEISVESVVESVPSTPATLDYAQAPAIPEPVVTHAASSLDVPPAEQTFSEPPVSDHTFLKQHVARPSYARRMAVVAAAIFAFVGVAGAAWFLWNYTRKDAPAAQPAPVVEPAAVTAAAAEPAEEADEPAVAEQAADEQAADEQAADEQAADEQAADERAADERAADERAGDERAGDERAADERAADERAADEQAGDERAADEQAADEQAADEQAADEQAADEQAADAQAADAQAADDEGTSRKTEYGRIPSIVSLEVEPEIMRLGFIRRRQLAGMHLRKGIKAQRRRQHEQAKGHFRRAVDYYPLQGASMRHLARYAMDERKLALAANWAFEATHADPRHHLSWMLLGEVQEKRGEWAGAQSAYREVVKLLPRHRTAKSKVRELGKKVKRASRKRARANSKKRARKRRGGRASRR